MDKSFEDEQSNSIAEAASCPSSTSIMVEDHSSYYFQDIIFLVENTRFKIPRHHFEQDSVVFRDMFSLPVAANSSPEGSTKENPLYLQGIAKSDFVPFLKVICPKHFQRREVLELSEWVSVLKLATMWEFGNVRTLAIATITPLPMDPILKSNIAKTCNVKQWYWPALCALGHGSQPLSEVIEHLGVDFGLRVAQLRGKVAGYQHAQTVSKALPVRATTMSRTCGYGHIVTISSLDLAPPALSDGIPTLKFIEEIFHEEVKDVPYAGCGYDLKISCRQQGVQIAE